LLDLRLRTEGEIRDKMQQRGYVLDVITTVINQLKDAKYVDDTRLASVLIENYKLYKIYGFFKIKQKLMEKRLPSGLIESSLEEFFPIEDELEVAKRFIIKEFPKYLTDKEKFTYQEKQKIGQKLQSRGFRMDVISKLVFS
jgi:regulatory protein